MLHSLLEIMKIAEYSENTSQKKKEKEESSRYTEVGKVKSRNDCV